MAKVKNVSVPRKGASPKKLKMVSGSTSIKAAGMTKFNKSTGKI